MSEDKNNKDNSTSNTPAGCDDAEDQFISQETQKDELDFTYAQGMRMVMYQCFWPILGNLFHPTYMLVNARVLG